MEEQNNDEQFMRRCIELSHKCIKEGGKPFGCLITKNNELVVEMENQAQDDLTQHAEILAMRETAKKLGTSDLSECTLYSNCEPCPMCAFMIREYKISRVVFALKSPFMGGASRWEILQDKMISRFKPTFSEPPIIESGVCEQEATKVFEEFGWTMHQ